MPIRRIKAQSPDPYLGKIQGDTELARLAHLNYVIDAINNGGGGGGGSITVNGINPVTDLSINFPAGTVLTQEVPNTGICSVILNLNYKAYRAKIAMQTIDWPGYGYLYNWYAVTDARKLENPSGGTGLTAPNEWRVPSDTDWNTLDTFAGGTGVGGGKLKSTLTSTNYPFYGWLSAAGTDDYNFSGLPGSFRDEFGSFNPLIGILGFFWTTNSVGTSPAISRTLDGLSNLGSLSINKGRGCSVRLVREATAGELLLNDGDTSDTSSLDPYTGNDGKTYVTVKIDTQIWLAQNLRETKYNDNSNIFNASIQGGDTSDVTWQAKGTAQEGAYTGYLFDGTSVQYGATTIRQFYNDVLENTLGFPTGFPSWFATDDVNGPRYSLFTLNRPWNQTHIKITPGYDVSNFPTINEKSLLIEEAVPGNNNIKFRPTKRDNTGAITIEDLNNYPGPPVSSIYVEILEYSPAYYGSGLSVALGASNLEDEEEIVALTYEINGVTYTEDLEAKKLSIEIAKIYDQLGIFDKYKV